MSASTAAAKTFDPAALQRLLDGPYAELRQQIRDVLCRPEFAPVIALPTGEYRERVLEWAKHFGDLDPRAVEACQDDSIKPVLSLLCDLYALYNLEADKGFFQEHGRLSSPRTKAITREVNRLCNEARQQAGAIVDAFGIPDQILAAPIGLK
jgi:Acyl-CoA oxidase